MAIEYLDLLAEIAGGLLTLIVGIFALIWLAKVPARIYGRPKAIRRGRELIRLIDQRDAPCPDGLAHFAEVQALMARHWISLERLGYRKGPARLSLKASWASAGRSRVGSEPPPEGKRLVHIGHPPKVPAG